MARFRRIDHVPGPDWHCFLLEDGTTTPWCMSRIWIEHPCYASFQLDSKRVAVIRCRAKVRPDFAREGPRCSPPWRSVMGDQPDWHDVGKWVQLRSDDELGVWEGRLEAEEHYETPVMKVAERSIYDFTHWRPKEFAGRSGESPGDGSVVLHPPVPKPVALAWGNLVTITIGGREHGR